MFTKVASAAVGYIATERALNGDRRAAIFMFIVVGVLLPLLCAPIVSLVVGVFFLRHDGRSIFHTSQGAHDLFMIALFSWGPLVAIFVVAAFCTWIWMVWEYARMAFWRRPRNPALPTPKSMAPSRPSGKSAAFQKLLPSLVDASGNDNRPVPKPVFAYLNGLGISSVTIKEAWQRKFFLALDGGIPQTARKRDLSKNGLLDAKGNLQVIPDHPLVFPLSRSGGAVAYGLPKAGAADTVFLGDPLQNDLFYWKGDPGNTEAMILKGPIDLLSAVDLGNRMTMFALHGYRFSESRIVQELLSLGCTKVWLGMDADEAGQAANAALVKILHAAGLYCMTITHDEGCRNINDVLRYRRALAEKKAETAPAKESARKEAQAQQTTAVPVLT